VEPAQLRSAVAAAKALAGELGLRAEDASVLSNSNRAMVRVSPSEVVARVSPASSRDGAAYEVEVGRRLAEAGCPVVGPDLRVEPHVYERDGFSITFWPYHEPVPEDLSPAEHAESLARLHAGMRKLQLDSPRFTQRIADAQRIVDDPEASPELGDGDRELLSRALRDLRAAILQRGAPEQLLHGEPHPGNLLRTNAGLLFIDLETCVVGPVEFDLPYLPEEARALYPGADPELLRDCEVLMQAMVAAWRWDRRDEFSGGLEMGREYLELVRAALR
jgi:aminoglycoside phosphotransferase (APT) family kinase protein